MQLGRVMAPLSSRYGHSSRWQDAVCAGTGTGWTFSPCTTAAFTSALANALETFRAHPDSFKCSCRHTCCRAAGHSHSLSALSKLPRCAGTGTGWTFSPCTTEAFTSALANATETYRAHPDSFMCHVAVAHTHSPRGCKALTKLPRCAGTGTGWTFSPCTTEAFTSALANALETYRAHPDSFRGLQQRGMQRDSSWDKAAAEYEQVRHHQQPCLRRRLCSMSQLACVLLTQLPACARWLMAALGCVLKQARAVQVFEWAMMDRSYA